ncbi:TrmH family RNA methyltransferase [Algoriphagus machipongonensis]|uniref:RNA methyltransferase, TrmH family n=1 Tax=Algoriphagus machipongonensis TaxID=388413 RepID=A3I1U5_9BACT|nr:RNA methyltransferase [Algoriphagus machipongonensis]EAZ79761.1 RNA methyltransferase, TrmH family [Algoriphagus machipongonensis]
MLSKNTVKFIKTLHQKKYRIQSQKFFVEGEKSVLEVINSGFLIDMILVTERFYERHEGKLKNLNAEILHATQNQLENIGQYRSNETALAVVNMKPNDRFSFPENELVIALDDVRDPGNLGTIIRIADWYGIKNLLFSSQTADFYNPKVIQSSMGSFTRVNFYYGDLKEVFEEWGVPIYGAYLGGSNIHELKSPAAGVLLMGNESNGISKELEPFVSKKLTIPGSGEAESLNVAIATAILCDNFCRLNGI